MPRRVQSRRRSDDQTDAAASAGTVATSLGRSLRVARVKAGMSQASVAREADVAQSTVSKMEKEKGATISLLVWMRVCRAAGSQLHAYLEHVTAADQPRDAVHLRAQELLVARAAAGGWTAMPEAALDFPAQGTRSADVHLERDPGPAGARAPEVVIIEVIDWFEDVGASFRDWDRRLARVEQRALIRLTRDDPITGQPRTPLVGGCWVVRATARNRELVSEHRNVFRARFPGPGATWLQAFAGGVPIPGHPALLWISVDGQRLWPARLL